MQNIILNSEQISIGNSIDKERKELIYELYKMFGKMSDAKLREMVLLNDSPIRLIYSIPEMLYCCIRYSIGIPKSLTKEWFGKNF